jgi:probable addiction module antidote protein
MRSRKQDSDLLIYLRDPENASEYVDAALQKGSAKSFLLALRRVVMAHGGMARVARVSKLTRESLYQMLSAEGNPEISSVWKVLKALGLRFCVTAKARS